jgi:uncharacterized protein (DUF1501 family)
MQSRRQWLARLAGAALWPAASGLWAAPASAGQKFVLVFLRGGYDCASLLVPVSSSFYYESRPNIAIARPGAAGGALALDANWGLHPALADSIMPLFQKRQAAFVPFSGTEDLSRSHFETQDSIELGQALGGSRDLRSGFLNRLAAELGAGDGKAIAFTEQLPVALRGRVDVPNVALASIGKPGVDERQSHIIEAMYGKTNLAAPVQEGFEVRGEALKSLQAEMTAASRNAMSARGFESVARRMAFLMRSRHDIGFVDVGGWDTHVGQGAAKGPLANSFEELGRGLVTFANEMGDLWAQTTVVVMSEFGRTFRENGNRGTDHGHGSVMWVLGGGLSGGRVVGDQAPVTAAGLFQNRDYPVLNDYRSVLGGLYAHLFGLDKAALQRVFPGAAPKDLTLV